MPLSLLDLPFHTEVFLIYCLKKMVLGAEWLLNEKLIFFLSAEKQQDGEEGKDGLGRTLGEGQPVSCQAWWSRRGHGSQFLGAHVAHSIVSFLGGFTAPWTASVLLRLDGLCHSFPA